MELFLQGIVVGIGGVAPGLGGSVLLHVALAVTGFLFVLDFSVKKPDWQRILTGK